MELRAKGTYRAPDFDLFEGQLTLDLSVEIAEERKARMLEDFPELFEVLDEAEELAIREQYAAADAAAHEKAQPAEEAPAEEAPAEEAPADAAEPEVTEEPAKSKKKGK